MIEYYHPTVGEWCEVKHTRITPQLFAQGIIFRIGNKEYTEWCEEFENYLIWWDLQHGLPCPD